jgi:hypothetical protein
MNDERAHGRRRWTPSSLLAALDGQLEAGDRVILERRLGGGYGTPPAGTVGTVRIADLGNGEGSVLFSHAKYDRDALVRVPKCWLRGCGRAPLAATA